MSFAEKLLNCVNCKKNFTFTVEEQEYRSSRGFPNDPGLCRPCRQARKTSSFQDEDSARTKVLSNSYFR
jgi:hypothetical protein